MTKRSFAIVKLHLVLIKVFPNDFEQSSHFFMLGIGFFEIVVIALVCFVAIGPKEMPAIMRKLAGFYRQFVLLKDEFRFQVMNVEQTLKQDIEKNLPEKNTENTDKASHG